MNSGTGDGGLIWEQDPVKRRKVAKKLLPAFSTKAIKTKEPVMHQHMDLFIEKMKSVGQGPEGVDLDKWMVGLAMDLSADLAYGRELHHTRDGKSSDFMDTLLGTNLLVMMIQLSKKFRLLRPLVFLFVPPRLMIKVPRAFKMNTQAVQSRIDNRGKTKHPDFVDYMVPADGPGPTTKQEKLHIEQVALQLFIAGFDPIQLLFFGCLFFFLKDPDVLDTVKQELITNFQSYDEITPDALTHLPYLNACIHETLRVHSVSAAGMPRTSPGAVVDGIYIPKGVVVQTSYFTIGRNPQNFHDPLNYHPARWLPSDHPKYEARFANDKLKSIYPFGLGPRVCAGREVAWSMIGLFLGKVLWTFDLEMIKGQDATFDKDYSLHIMWYKPNVRVRFVPR
ncbi:Uu.00g117360.m01.CDS01 [Anthostomella pinea]|uniref:Uu.00g117360.m01.CDS01 n=1 Tax=Anthostomella pinea TaxID=933095 RepID=A0AAI8VAZ5_9PEZI|nr:Uu.00g117360.m01.CDS01 [Anthostomella pinea]